MITFLDLCFPFSAYRTTCSLHIHLQGQTDPYRESYNVWSWSSKEYSLTSYYLKLPFFTKINSKHVAFSSYSGWAYNRVKIQIPSCKNFEAKEGMGLFSRGYCSLDEAWTRTHAACSININLHAMTISAQWDGIILVGYFHHHTIHTILQLTYTQVCCWLVCWPIHKWRMLTYWLIPDLCWINLTFNPFAHG